VETAPSPHTVDIADFHAGESGENQQPYRALLIVTDGTAPGAETISITWPVDDENEWVPLAYAGGAAVAVVGLVLLVVSLSTGRRRVESESAGAEEAEHIEPSEPGHDEPSEPGHDQPAPAAPTTPRSSTRSTKPVPARRSPDEPPRPLLAPEAGPGHPCGAGRRSAGRLRLRSRAAPGPAHRRGRPRAVRTGGDRRSVRDPGHGDPRGGRHRR